VAPSAGSSAPRAAFVGLLGGAVILAYMGATFPWALAGGALLGALLGVDAWLAEAGYRPRWRWMPDYNRHCEATNVLVGWSTYHCPGFDSLLIYCLVGVWALQRGTPPDPDDVIP
jgi:hypothetical protein